jgi:nicotinate-nucleotide pyrophosphorylase (carboxylating)
MTNSSNRSYARHPLARDIIDLALREDIGRGDITTAATVEPSARGSGYVIAKQPLVVSGVELAPVICTTAGVIMECELLRSDGEPVPSGTQLVKLSGLLSDVLTVERTVLNFMGRMCGIATATAALIKELDGTRARLLDTRKTAPGLRILDKAAVRHGGGCNHRFGLDDGVLIKDNHITAAGSITVAVKRAREQLGHRHRIEVEVVNIEGLSEAIAAGADMVLLDNMSVELIRKAVAAAAGRVQLEASGGITQATLRKVAQTGVDFISMGALTHSSPAADVSMDVISLTPRVA